jgi:hypothetical protein
MDDQNRRDSPRYSISLYTEFVEREASPSRILNMSKSGFLICGDICAGAGGVIKASFKVRPSSGEMRVSARGKVVHARRADNGEYEYGVKITDFGSSDEEEAYLAYVGELSRAAETHRTWP